MDTVKRPRFWFKARRHVDKKYRYVQPIKGGSIKLEKSSYLTELDVKQSLLFKRDKIIKIKDLGDIWEVEYK